MRLAIKALVAVIFFTTTTACVGSIQRLDELKPFHMTVCDTLDTAYVNFIEHSIDSVQKAECAEPFLCVKVEKVYGFKDLPGILYCTVFSCKMTTGRKEHARPYENFLFNTSDASIYPFGGGWIRFSKLLRDYLPRIFDSNDSLKRDLIELYLNTLDQDYDYYRFVFKEELPDIWDHEYQSCPGIHREMTKKEIRKELKEMIIFPNIFEATQRDGIKEINIYTWNTNRGMIEWWRFYLSRTTLQVREHYIKYFNKGSYFDFH